MVIDTGKTLEEGLTYLKQQGIQGNPLVATIYITPGARFRMPTILYAYETSKAREVLNQLPWIIDEYHYL